MKAAAARGRKGGWPAVNPDAEKVRPASHYRLVGLTPPEIAKLLGVSRATAYRYLALVAA
ncbi:helix-turn-helix domain-containing protein [Microbacterium sp. A93]|uniref:helix-turn-helix domain-containing protein n=1 Tax=Microbacterium sp. A93 TaxID=3450716 RepID=UPI003F437D5A